MTTRAAILCILALAAATPAAAGSLVVDSPDMVAGGTVAVSQVFGRCGGGNRAPALSWSGAPDGTRSFAVTLFDPDARNGDGWWHWVVYDIPAAAGGLPADGMLPAGAIPARNDFGIAGYGGPCPPAGDSPHHYQLTVWALDVAHLPAGPGAAAAAVARLIESHALDHAGIVARYGR